MKEYRVITNHFTSHELVGKIHITNKQYTSENCYKVIKSAIADITFGELNDVDKSENYEAKLMKSDLPDYSYAIAIYRVKIGINYAIEEINRQNYSMN